MNPQDIPDHQCVVSRSVNPKDIPDHNCVVVRSVDARDIPNGDVVCSLGNMVSLICEWGWKERKKYKTPGGCLRTEGVM